LLNRENTVIIAPTGMGKTTLLIIYALYMAGYGKKTVYLTPTRALARQVYGKILEYMSRVHREYRVLIYDSSMSKNKRSQVLEAIRNSEFDILVATNNFFIKKHEYINPSSIDILIIDDVDSLLKSDSNVKRLINLIGYSDQVLELLKEKYRILWKLSLSRAFDKRELIREYVNRLLSIEKEIDKYVKNTPRKQVVIASATGRMSGLYAKMLKDLLMIDISGITIYGRNIADAYNLFDGSVEEIVDVVKKLGPGGLILISPRHPYRDRINTIVDKLRDELVKSGFKIEEANPKSIERMKRGELDLLTGSSSYYGVVVRGIDAPERIKYVVFIGTPMFTIELDKLLANLKLLVRTAIYLYEQTGDGKYREYVSTLRGRIYSLTPGEQRIVSLILKGRVNIEDVDNDKIKSVYSEIHRLYSDILVEVKKHVERNKIISLNTITLIHVERNGKYLALIPDIYTYIQASGRTSRLYHGSMTHGLSIIFEFKELENVVKALDTRLGFLTGGCILRDLSEVDLEFEVKQIVESRSVKTNNVLKYRNILFIVESPTKAKTIARFFGKPVKRKIGSIGIYEIPFMKDGEIIHLNVVATRGHIFDLTTDPNRGLHGVIFNGNYIQPFYDTIKKCLVCGYQFTHGDKCIKCGSTSIIDSHEVINVLRKIAQEAHEIYIATDPDIEGEKIAYDVYLVVKPFNKNIWRVELHEITLKEFMKALDNKRFIDKRLVEAEIYRRILDRLIGFSLTSRLWNVYGLRYLGAGRVQTPVLGWIIERYNEYLANKCRWIVYGFKNIPGFTLKISIPWRDRELYEKLLNVDRVVFKRVDERVEVVNPPPPYTTDQLLYDAGRLGLSTSTTMRIAQDLFESGLITYHRTNSTYVSSNGINIAAKYLSDKGLKEYFKPSHWGSPGTHEAIRPVYPLDRLDLEKAISERLINPVIPLTNLHLRVYELIFNRFIASQMKPYRVVKYRYIIEFNGLYSVEKEIDVNILEDGFNLVLKPRIVNTLYGREIHVDEPVVLARYKGSTKSLYREGDVVLLMKSNGLGRPSTYAKIIESLRRHGYVIRSKRGEFLVPTKMGIEVYRYLSINYPELVSVETTRFMEENIDRIIKGELTITSAIDDLIDVLNNHGLIQGFELLTTSISS